MPSTVFFGIAKRANELNFNLVEKKSFAIRIRLFKFERSIRISRVKDTLKKATFEQGPLDDSIALSSGFILEMFHTDQFDNPITSDQESFSKFKII